MDIPRQLVDPRRPEREPTMEEKMEGLMKYNPALPVITTATLSYYNEVKMYIVYSFPLSSTECHVMGCIDPRSD